MTVKRSRIQPQKPLLRRIIKEQLDKHLMKAGVSKLHIIRKMVHLC